MTIPKTSLAKDVVQGRSGCRQPKTGERSDLWSKRICKKPSTH